MGMSMTPVYFYDIGITVGEVISASDLGKWQWEGRTLGSLPTGRLMEYDDRPGHFLYTCSPNAWCEFQEAA